MNREHLRDRIAAISSEAWSAKEHAERTWDMARALEREMRLAMSDEPEEGQEDDAVYTDDITFDGTTLTVPSVLRASASFAVARGMPRLFVEVFALEHDADGDVYVEQIVVLHNGDPQGLGAVRLPHLVLDTPSRVMGYETGMPLTIAPGGIFVALQYDTQPTEFWGRAAAPLIARAKRTGAVPEGAFEGMLEDHLEDLLHGGPAVGPYPVMWTKRGGGEGGQGVEPDRFGWRYTAAGIAGAVGEMVRTANRFSRVMTNERGEFTWDRGERHTSDTGFNMPPAFDWIPDDSRAPYESELATWWNIDANHLARQYGAALWLAQVAQHPFAQWFLEAQCNHQAACHLGTRGDTATDGWWSLQRKIEAVTGRYGDKFSGVSTEYPDAHSRDRTNKFVGRGGAHEARLARACARLHIGGSETVEVATLYERLFEVSLNDDGLAHSVWGKYSTEAPKAWDNDRVFQTRNAQLGLLMYENSGSEVLRRAVEPLRDFLTDAPRSVRNLKTGEQQKGVQDLFALATHGNLEPFGGDSASLLALAKTRGVDTGIQPLNYDRKMKRKPSQ